MHHSPEHNWRPLKWFCISWGGYRDPFSTFWWNTANAEDAGAPVKHQCLWSGSLLQCFASWLYKDESCPSHPVTVVTLHIPQTLAPEILTFFPPSVWKMTRCCSHEQDQLPAVCLKRYSPRGPSCLRREIPARSAMKNSPAGLSSPLSQSSRLAIIFCETCIWKQNASFPEPWKSRQKAKWIAQGKYMQGAVHRVCFKPPLPELLLALHWNSGMWGWNQAASPQDA